MYGDPIWPDVLHLLVVALGVCSAAYVLWAVV